MTADITRINTAAETRLIDQFKSAHGAVPVDPDGRRTRAMARFGQVGLPHRRIEAWHYTDLRKMMRDAYAPAVPPAAEVVARAKALVDRVAGKGARAVLIDGHYVAELSAVEKGVTVRSLIDVLGGGTSNTADLLAIPALEEQEAVLSLNAAFMQGGAVVEIAAGAELAHPVEIVFIASGAQPTATTTRSLVQAGPGARAMIVERHEALAAAPNQGNHVLVAQVGDGAALEHIVVTPDTAPDCQQVATLVASIGAEAEFTGFALVSGGGFVRRQSFVTFAGVHAKGTLRGVVLLDGEGHCDTTLVATHKATHCESRELFKHILDGTSTGVFQGKVIVAPGAQKTDGKMMSRAIFLADGATMYNKPELEIFADDVVCGHGATAGFLNEDQLFYLRGRGIPKKEAEALLLEAFAAEAIEDIGTAAIRAELTDSVGRWLRRHQS